jgi:hypothetical protein
MGAASVRTHKEYTLFQTFNYYQRHPQPVTQPVTVAYRVERSSESEFGDTPLPGGPVRIYQRDDAGRLQLLGIATLGNTPRGQELMLPIGNAFEIVGNRTQTEYARPDGATYEAAWRVELTNGSDEDVAVQVVERVTGDWRILESSHDPEKLSANLVRFQVDVPAGGSAMLTYRVQVRT